MKKERVEAFTDAIVAIIMTIMVLEMKVPKAGTLTALLDERSYFFAYLISFFLIATTWYNHHYLFTYATWISKRAFWANCVWLFMMSLAPVATGWISEFPSSRTTAYFYLLVYILWGMAFRVLMVILIQDNPKKKERLGRMAGPKRSWLELSLLLVALVVTYFVPILCLVILGLNSVVWIINTPKGSDRILS
ncbi:TMEM175 family protein [Levilactobacillus acidifarinae]|uniref:Integral membrane protein n=1 Tax=Levilactobacillus acidifarinae DSM 19394 = JCM 15949 TaxID=1423715 RepID=A0A0R1LJ17_9LACO|nr:TMEM175 family protein [Levilactobacillus acidifarinae]KRK95915.1 integral membrane protein [Levilactobacillus acidifarinae DSM 19394]GEO69216.1 membrane protein [Levilactobacillus acidifarinae]